MTRQLRSGEDLSTLDMGAEGYTLMGKIRLCTLHPDRLNTTSLHWWNLSSSVESLDHYSGCEAASSSRISLYQNHWSFEAALHFDKAKIPNKWLDKNQESWNDQTRPVKSVITIHFGWSWSQIHLNLWTLRRMEANPFHKNCVKSNQIRFAQSNPY
jgi:hypothetical protein